VIVFKEPIFIVKSLRIMIRSIRYLCIDGCFRLHENVLVAISALFVLLASNYHNDQ
jgi:hypothetical protein